MPEELLRLLREPQRYVAIFRNGEIHIKEFSHALRATGYIAIRGEEIAPAVALSHGFRL